LPEGSSHGLVGEAGALFHLEEMTYAGGHWDYPVAKHADDAAFRPAKRRLLELPEK